MKTYTAGKLSIIIEKHGKWLLGEHGGKRANLTGADLSGADLSGANLTRANLTGARGFVYIGQRSDGYRFFATYQHEKWLVQAGCRLCNFSEYRAHTKTYECEKKRAETLLILDFAEAMVAIRGIV